MFIITSKVLTLGVMRAWDNTQTCVSHAQCVRLGRSVNLIEISVLVTYSLFSTYRKYAILF